MTNIYRQPYLSVTVAGGTLSDVLAARVQCGYDMRVASAEVLTRSLPAAAVPWGTVEVTMGGNQATAGKRFSGYFIGSEQELFEHGVRLVCKGQLQRAQTFTAQTDVDMSSYAIDPVTYGHKDEVMVSTVLYIVGVSGTFPPGGEQSMAGIEGTGRMMGSLIHNGFGWHTGETAISFIERLEEVTLGYRTFDAMDGTIQRKLITTVPAGSADWTFTEGVDIFRATESETILDARNQVIVNGWNGDKTERTYTAHGANPWLLGASGTPDYQWYSTQNISSPLIEHGDVAAPTAGVSAREVAIWKLGELNRRVERVVLTTPRDDLVQPADTVKVIAPTRLGITDSNYWVQNVDVSVDRRGQFSQVLTCLGSLWIGTLGEEGLSLEAGDNILLETGAKLLKE